MIPEATIDAILEAEDECRAGDKGERGDAIRALSERTGVSRSSIHRIWKERG